MLAVISECKQTVLHGFGLSWFPGSFFCFEQSNPNGQELKGSLLQSLSSDAIVALRQTHNTAAWERPAFGWISSSDVSQRAIPCLPPNVLLWEPILPAGGSKQQPISEAMERQIPC